MLQIITHEADGVFVITCELPEGTAGEMGPPQRESLYQAVQSRPDPRFAVDLGSIDYLASADIGFLISLKRRIDGRQGQMVLFNIHPILVDILRTMKLLKFFTIADDLQEALALLPPTPKA
jgi:anti-sigma B factor antagonist